MERLIDEVVKVSVTDAIAAADATNVNTVAVLGVSTETGAAVKKCYSKQEIADEFGSSSGLYGTAKSFFEGANPGSLVCIPAASEPSVSDVAATLEDALETEDFYHIVFRPGSSATAENIIALIVGDSSHDGISKFCDTNSKVAHVEIDDRTKANAVADGIKEANVKRVAVYFHDESTAGSLAAQLVAERCSKDPARGTWAHKTLNTIVADATSKAQLNTQKDKGVNFYAKVAGVARTFFGTIGGSAKSFIDSRIKKDWVKFRIQEAIFNLLGSANNGDGVDFNDSGFGSVAAAANTVLSTAADSDHRYILPDSYEVIVPTLADIPSTHKEVRNLPNMRVIFSIQDSLHTVKTVEIQVVD